MPTPQPLCDVDLLARELGSPPRSDMALLDQYITDATAGLEAVTGKPPGAFSAATYTAVTVRPGRARVDAAGTLVITVPQPHITAVTAASWRQSPPPAAFTAVSDLSTVDWDPTALRSGVITIYGTGWSQGPAWAKLTYTAGWAGTPTDPYPTDLQAIIRWWAAWLYRRKDLPFDRSGNGQMGTTIPTDMPKRLQQAVARWQEWMLV